MVKLFMISFVLMLGVLVYMTVDVVTHFDSKEAVVQMLCISEHNCK